MKLCRLLIAVLIAVLVVALAGCAGTPLDPRGPHGEDVEVVGTVSPVEKLDVVFVFNSLNFGKDIGGQLTYLRSANFSEEFSSQFSKVTEHNGLKANVSVLDIAPSRLSGTTLIAEVVEVSTYHGAVNRFKYVWQLRSPDGRLLATWHSTSIWESTRRPDQNARDYWRGIAHLALVALNTLGENSLAKIANSPARTLSGGRVAVY